MRGLLFSRVPVVLAAASLLVLSCGVDESGLNQKPFLPHDAAATDAAGVAGAAGGASGTAGVGGSTPSGVAGVGGGISGVAGTGSAGDAGTTGGDGGTPGTGGTTGVAGEGGAAGMGGDSGVAGAAGGGVAGLGGVGGGGVAGMGGGGVGGGGLAGVGGSAGGGGAGIGGGAGGRGGAGSGGRGGTTGVCNQFNCSDGCCDSGTCVRQRTAQKCGSGGQACAACGGCQLCTTLGQCRIDSASRWTIIAVSATLSGGGWDRNFGDMGGSAPDPFCEFENPAGQVSSTTAGVTDTIVDDATATWNQVITPPGMTVAASTLMANNPTWQIWVGDDDGCSGPSGCLGDIACTYTSSIPETALRAGEITISNRMSCSSLKLQFVCQAPLAVEE
jgi:hypothetical protein